MMLAAHEKKTISATTAYKNSRFSTARPLAHTFPHILVMAGLPVRQSQRQGFHDNTRRQEHFEFAKLPDNTCLHCRSIDLINLKYLASFRATAIALRHSPKRPEGIADENCSPRALPVLTHYRTSTRNSKDGI